MLRELLKDDKASSDIQIIDDVAHCQLTSVRKETGPDIRYEMTWLFNFADVTRDELISIASRELKVNLRSLYKAQKDEIDWDGKEFSIREYLDRERRQTKSKVEQTENLWEKMTDAQKEQFMENHGLSAS